MKHNRPDSDETSSEKFSSNVIRLSSREWLWTLGICLALLFVLPTLWPVWEKFEPDEDYRLPYPLGEDYWLFQRISRWSANQYDVLVIGDSVFWGDYVEPNQTLPHCLNEQSGRQHFANLAINGIHPIALAGLLEYYGKGIADTKVVLNFNPLWLSSPGADLQDEKETRIHHSRLFPQWTDRIPCDKENIKKRIDFTLQRYLGFRSWINHLQICYLSDDAVSSLSQWTLDHPYQNPFTLRLPVPENKPHSTKIRWDPNTGNQSESPWVELETSLQWQFFRKAVKILHARGNQVFVLVGPFNEHMLPSDNLAIYRQIQTGIENWLRKNEIPYFMPAALPSKYYADSSHPLAKGYEILAEQLYNHPSFRAFITKADANEADKK